MINADSTGSKILSSDWSGLSEHLIAKFYEVSMREDGSAAMIDGPQVHCPLLETNLEAQLNWQSPFENNSPETKLPAVTAMLQSGVLQPFFNQIAQNLGDMGMDKAAEIVRGAIPTVQNFEGRTGITKLNSTQVFTGMPPVKFQTTALFRALKDAKREVEDPIDHLMQWALPKLLAKDGMVMSLLQGKRLIDVPMPSKAPSLLALQYKGRTYAPLVVESIGQPLHSPITWQGHFASMQVPMTLCTLTAWDRNDWTATRNS
jgi:hypothetical protein